MTDPARTGAGPTNPAESGDVAQLGDIAATAGYGDPAQKYIFIADLQNGTVWQLDRQSGEILGHISHKGPNAGEFFRAHVAAMDSKSNVYVGEIGDGSRVQKFTPN